MFRNVSKFVAAALLAAVVTHSTQAHAYAYLTTTGTVASAYFIWQFLKKDAKADAAKETKVKQEAEEYVRQNSAQLTQDIALASGPMINDMAAAMNIAPEHKAEFRKVIQANRTELLELAAVEVLNGDRAAKFFTVIAEKAQANPILAADIANAQNS